jgi:cellobiose phosphorylase
MHQLVTGSLLGLRVRDGRLGLQPCVPAAWSGYAIDYTWRTSNYAIEAVRIGVGNAVATVEVDGEMQPGTDFELRDDGRHHEVRITFGGV